MTTHPRITVEAEKCGGKPCIRGYRITVEHILGLLAEGISRDEILNKWDFLEPADIDAALRFAVRPAHKNSTR